MRKLWIILICIFVLLLTMVAVSPHLILIVTISKIDNYYDICKKADLAAIRNNDFSTTYELEEVKEVMAIRTEIYKFLNAETGITNSLYGYPGTYALIAERDLKIKPLRSCILKFL